MQSQIKSIHRALRDACSLTEEDPDSYQNYLTWLSRKNFYLSKQYDLCAMDICEAEQLSDRRQLRVRQDLVWYKDGTMLSVQDLNWVVHSSTNAHSNWSVAYFKNELIMYEAETTISQIERRTRGKIEAEIAEFAKRTLLSAQRVLSLVAFFKNDKPTHSELSKRLHCNIKRHLLDMMVDVDNSHHTAHLRLEANAQYFYEVEEKFCMQCKDKGIEGMRLWRCGEEPDAASRWRTVQVCSGC